MKTKNEMRATFPFEYNKKPFSCIFLADVLPLRLYLTTLGDNPLSFEFELDENYFTDTFMKDYYSLLEYLELKYDPKHKFSPNDMLEVLNRKIPITFSAKPKYPDVIRVVSKNRTVEECNKIYFCGWYTNPEGKGVRPENYEKTLAAFGQELANTTKQRRISSKWTDKSSEEDLSTINRYA
jgi:hypothetical protein